METTTDLFKYNTFRLHSSVENMLVFSGGNIKDFFTQNKHIKNVFILGGGSNIILPPKMTDTTIIKMENKGIEILTEDEKNVTLRIASGEIWDEVVAYAVDKNYSGVEALSAIPGTVGATPIQNVGAYGAEIKDVLAYVEAYDIEKNEIVKISNTECEFGYRDSVFKKKSKGKFVITHIVINLTKDNPSIPNYKGVQEYFKNKNIEKPSLKQIRDAIIEIRWSKLPKPSVVPNCGSFFENPIVEKNLADKIKIDYPDMPEYKINNEKTKIPAGWLVEHTGLKGVNFDNVGTYEKNALVLVNSGEATQANVVKARDEIIEKVYQKFGITLESEPEIIN